MDAFDLKVALSKKDDFDDSKTVETTIPPYSKEDTAALLDAAEVLASAIEDEYKVITSDDMRKTITELREITKKLWKSYPDVHNTPMTEVLQAKEFIGIASYLAYGLQGNVATMVGHQTEACIAVTRICQRSILRME